MDYRITEGNYNRFGAEQTREGLTFTFVCAKEEICRIIFYNENMEVEREVEIPAEYYRGDVRSVCFAGWKPKKVYYNYRIGEKVQTDPYATGIMGRERWRDEHRIENPNRICGYYEAGSFAWKYRQPERSRSELILYKLHVRGFSMDAGMRGRAKGTFSAIESRIPYLKELGITAVELMPAYEFEEMERMAKQEMPDYLKHKLKENPLLAKEEDFKIRLNYWGYTGGFYFAPKASYSRDGKAAREYRHLIDALHKNQMECVMEFYFEKEENENRILDVLHYWAREYRVDGFHLIGENLPVRAIAQDPYLKRTKIFLPYIPENIWGIPEKHPHLFLYNDEFLYAGRKLLNHQGGSAEEFCNQLKKQNKTIGFVNYFSSQNGFTLADVFSYNEKHNEENGENNADGMDYNFSWNCGVEGKTNKAYVKNLRRQHMYMALAMTFLSQAVPLLLAGDEIGNSQKGNNNAYCQDNKTGWVNWNRSTYAKEMVSFVRNLTAFRRSHPVICMETPMRMNDYLHVGSPDLSFHEKNAWVSSLLPQDHAFGVMYNGAYAVREDGKTDDDIYIGYNFHEEERELALPKLSGGKKWYCVMDTGEMENPFYEKMRLSKDQQKRKIKALTAIIMIGK